MKGASGVTPVFVRRRCGKSGGAVPELRRGYLDRHVKMWIFADKINYKYQVSRETMKLPASFHVKRKCREKQSKSHQIVGFFGKFGLIFSRNFRRKIILGAFYQNFLQKKFVSSYQIFERLMLHKNSVILQRFHTMRELHKKTERFSVFCDCLQVLKLLIFLHNRVRFARRQCPFFAKLY